MKKIKTIRIFNRDFDGAGGITEVLTCINIKLPEPIVPPDSSDSDDGPPFFGDVVFLSSFDGADGSTSATDDSLYGHTIAFHDGAQIDTAQSKFGGASLLVQGGGGLFDRVQCANASEFLLGASSFTIECWLYLINSPVSTLGLIMGLWNLVPGDGLSWRFEFQNGNLLFQGSTNGSVGGASLNVASGMSSNTWYHVAAERNESGLVRIYVDGAVIGSTTITDTFFASTSAPFTVGCRTQSGPLVANIDEARLSRRPWYDGAFTPPVAPFPR